MKIITLIILCLTLNTAIACAEQVHLVATWLNGDLVDPATSKPPKSPAYVLLLPIHESDGRVVINPVVFTTFDVKAIGLVIRGAVIHGYLARGSVLALDVGSAIKPPPDEQIKALTDYCKEQDITVGISPTA
jgi:hypothetical protein